MIEGIQNKDDFLKEFSKLKKRFIHMEPELEVTVYDPDYDVTGYIVVWNTKICKDGPFDRNGKGIGKGGTRILPNLELSDVRRLAKAMAEKNAAAGLPLGGAKSGLVADHTSSDYEQKCRRFYKMVQDTNILAENGGKFGGFGFDVGNIPPKNAEWACEELGTLNSFTGKPVEQGGTDYDREGIAGLGVANAARTIVQNKNNTVKGSCFSVQGLGAMGAAVAYYYHEYGGKLTHLSDPKYGGTWNVPGGASDKLINALFNQDELTTKSLLKSEGNLISDDPQEALYADVDVVFPCALEDTITAGNAHKIVAPYICEGANNPTTEEAHDILFSNGQIVVPDIIANAGGIIAAFVELSVDIPPEENAKTRKKVELAKIETMMRVNANTKELLQIVDAYHVRPDIAGDYISYRNIFYGIPEFNVRTEEQVQPENKAVLL